ncbi:MAG: isochorismatase family protein [Clostridiales bacterium]|nr:isochorismatase family protein [Clostridiales bacterium]
MDKFTLHSHEAVLMIIDIQQRLASVMERREQVVKNAGILVDTAQKLGIPTVVTEQYPKGLGKTVDELSGKLDTDYVFEKIAFSACTEEVMSTLERLGRKKIIVTGMETHVCVLQTVRELLSLGYMVFVAEDTVCSRTRENHNTGLSLMRGMGAVITSAETVFFDLLKQAGTPLYKELSKLIK